VDIQIVDAAIVQFTRENGRVPRRVHLNPKDAAAILERLPPPDTDEDPIPGKPFLASGTSWREDESVPLGKIVLV